MTRPHRLWHLRIWLVLAPLLAAGLAAALASRASANASRVNAAIPACCRAPADSAESAP